MPSEHKEATKPEKSKRETADAVRRPKVEEAGKRSMQGTRELREDTIPEGLKRNMAMARREVEGGPREGYNIHHAIPVEQAENSAVFRDAARRAGYNINNGNNLMSLPEEKSEAQKTGEQQHKGPHPKEYREPVAKRLEALDERHRRYRRETGKKWDVSRLNREVRKAETDTRKDVTEHKIPTRKPESGTNT
jgi:hypothetical protein